MDPCEVQTVLNWETLSSVRDVKYFLGFANFYFKFIKIYLNIAMPLTELTQKSGKFKWNATVTRTFDNVKKAFTSAPTLMHVDQSKPFFIDVDASYFAFRSIFSQSTNDGKQHPIAYHSCKYEAAKINYEINEKELLAIVDSFEKCRRFRPPVHCL